MAKQLRLKLPDTPLSKEEMRLALFERVPMLMDILADIIVNEDNPANVRVHFSAKHRGYESLLNVVEDALVERLTMGRWPGVRANLDAMFRQVRGRVMSRLREAGPFRRFCTAVYLKLSHHRDMLGLPSPSPDRVAMAVYREPCKPR